MLPSWLPQIVVECSAGRFPQGDEAELRRLGQGWSDRAEESWKKAREHEEAARSPGESYGEYADAIRKQHEKLAERFHRQATRCDNLARALFEFANTVELVKFTVVGILVILTMALARCALMFAAGGAIEAAVQRMAARNAIEWAWKKALQLLSGRLAQLAAERGGTALAAHAMGMGALQGGGLNAAAQGIQVLQGNREEIDRKAAGVATAAGMAGGIAGLLVARWLGPKVGAYAAGVEGKAKRITVQLVGTAGIGGLGGLGGAIGGTAVSLGLTGEAFTTEAFAEGLLPGFLGGAVMAGGYAARDIRGIGVPAQSTGPSDPAGSAPGLAAREAGLGDLAAVDPQIDGFVSALQFGNAVKSQPQPASVVNDSGAFRPTGPITLDLPSGVTVTVDPSVPGPTNRAPSPVASSADAGEAPASSINAEPAAGAHPAPDKGAGGGRPGGVDEGAHSGNAQPSRPRVNADSTTSSGHPAASGESPPAAGLVEPVAGANKPGTAENDATGAQAASSKSAPDSDGAAGPGATHTSAGTRQEGTGGGPTRPNPVVDEQVAQSSHRGEREVVPPPQVADASADALAVGKPAEPVPAAATAEENPAQQNSMKSESAEPVSSELHPTGPRNGSDSAPADRDAEPVVPVAGPEASTAVRDTPARPAGDGDGAGQRTASRPSAGETPPASAGRGDKSPADRSEQPPAVSAPKSAASDRPPAVTAARSDRGQADDSTAQRRPAGAADEGGDSGDTATSAAQKPEARNTRQNPATTDEDSGKAQAKTGEPEPKSGNTSDDSPDEQHAQADADAPPADGDENPAADVRARARAEVEQRIAAERLQNELVREHHRQRVAAAAEREKAALAELKRQEKAVRVAAAHEWATRLGRDDHQRELIGPSSAADRVAVEAARAAKEQLRQAQAKAAESRDAYDAAVSAHDVAARSRAHDLVELSDKAGVSLMNDFEAGVLTDREAVFDVVAQERVHAALDAGRAIGAMRDPGASADGTSPMANASPESLVEMMVHGSREERIAAMTEWIRRGDDRHRLVRETQAAAFLLLEHGPVDMKTGEGKTIVMVMKLVSDAVDHGTAHAWTSSDLLAGELAGELYDFAVRPESETRIDIFRIDQDGPLPDPVPGRYRIVVGTKEDYLFRALKVADSMLNDFAAAGMSHQKVTEIRDFINTKPSIDLIKERLDAAASDLGLDIRFDPFPMGKLTIDEFDTIFDGNSECVLSPGAAEEAPREVVAELWWIWERMAIAEREHNLTAADFNRPANTRGMWAAETTPAAVVKLERAGGAPVTTAELKLFAQAANARWGLERGTHYITRLDEGGGKIGVLAHETNDKAMWDRTKLTDVRWQGVGQFVDLKEGVPVLADQEHSLRMSDHQLIGSKLLFDPSGLSGTMKGVEGITYDLYGLGPVPELPTFYVSNRVIDDPIVSANKEKSLQTAASDVLTHAEIVNGEQTGRPQWITVMDNGDARGDPQSGRKGLVDYLHEFARERYGDEFELRVVVIDAQLYAELGGSSAHAEAFVRGKIKEFGSPGDILIINKEGGRGAEATPTEESIALGGVLGKTIGGPGYSDRVNDQVDGRVARGGSGDDRKTGGTPGSTVHYISPEDFLGRVADHGVMQQIFQYTKAAENYVRAEDEHAKRNDAATLDRLEEAEAVLRNAESDLWKKAVPAMMDAIEKDQLALKYANVAQANAPPADAHGTANRQPPHHPPETTASQATGRDLHTQAPHTPVTTHNGPHEPASAGFAVGTVPATSGSPPASPSLPDEHGDSTLHHILHALNAPGGQAAAPLLPLAQTVRDAAFGHVETQGLPIGTNVVDHVHRVARNLLDSSLSQLDPAERQLVADTGTALQHGRTLSPAQTGAVTHATEQVRSTVLVLPAAVPDIATPFDQLPALDRTEMLRLAQQGDRSAGQTLDRHFGPATAQAMLAVMGWTAERESPPPQIQALAHAVARATLDAADAGGWQVPPGVDIGGWLIGEATDIWLDGHNLLNPAARRIVTDALNPHSRDDLTDAQVALFSWVTREITARATGRQQFRADDRTTSPNMPTATDSERDTKQAIARQLFENYGVEVLGLDKPAISVETAQSIRNAIADGYAARKDFDDMRLDVVIIAPMVGDIGACLWNPEIGEEDAPTLMVLNEDLFGNPEKFRETMQKAARAGRSMAPTGDPAYDTVSHEMAHLQDMNALMGIYDSHPMDHSPVREESSEDSKAARAFGYLFSHFTELKKFGLLPADAEFSTWLGQLDAYSSGRKKPENAEEDRLFEAFESWLSRFESRAHFDIWLRESGLSRTEIDDRRRPDSGLAEDDAGAGWVDLETVYKTWRDSLDENTRRRIRDGEEYGQAPTYRDPDAERLELDAARLRLGALEVFNPEEALAEAANAFGRAAPADHTHPVYALQALLRGVSYAQVLKDAEQRNVLALVNYRGPVPAASEFGASIASKGPATSIAETWRSKSPAERADFVERQAAYLNPDRGDEPGFVLDELVRLEERHRAESSLPQTPVATTRQADTARPRWRSPARQLPPLALDLGGEDEATDARGNSVGSRPSGEGSELGRDSSTPARDRSSTDVPSDSGLDGPGESDWTELGFRVQRLLYEVELARELFHRKATRDAAVAMVKRLRVVLRGLYPDVTDEQIDYAFFAPENVGAGPMVPRSVTLDELLRDGNVRELMAAVSNAIVRSGELPETSRSKVTLYDGIAALLNEQDWDKAQRLGLNVPALQRVREKIVGDDPEAVIETRQLRDVRNLVRHPEDDHLAEERTRSSAAELKRDEREQVRRGLTVQDWQLLGMPLTLRELAAIPGDLVKLRISRLDPLDLRDRKLPRKPGGRVDIDALEAELKAKDEKFRFAIPLYKFDKNGRRLADKAGNAEVSGVLLYHKEGVVDAETALTLDPLEYAVPLPFAPGAAQVDIARDSVWFQMVVGELGFTTLAGFSGTAGRYAAALNWLQPEDAPEDEKHISVVDFAGAVLAFLSPHHHSLYEQVRAMQMSGLRLVDEEVWRSPDGPVALYRAVFDLFGIPMPTGSARIAPFTRDIEHQHPMPASEASKTTNPHRKRVTPADLARKSGGSPAPVPRGGQSVDDLPLTPAVERRVAGSAARDAGDTDTIRRDPVELSEDEVRIVRLVADIGHTADQSAAQFLGYALGLDQLRVNRLLVRLNARIGDATTVHAATRPDTAAKYLQLSTPQLETLRSYADQAAEPTTAVSAQTLRAFRANLTPRPSDNLSDREIEVLNLLMRGHSVRAAAKMLDLAPETVGRDFAHAAEELGTRGVIPTVLAAVRAGVLDNDTGPSGHIELSELQARAIQLVADGATNRTLRAELNLGLRKTRALMSELRNKFDVDSTLGLVLAAQRRRLLDDIGHRNEICARRSVRVLRALGNMPEMYLDEDNHLWDTDENWLIVEEKIAADLVDITTLEPGDHPAHPEDPIDPVTAQVAATLRASGKDGDTAVVVADGHGWLVTMIDGSLFVHDTSIRPDSAPRIREYHQDTWLPGDTTREHLLTKDGRIAEKKVFVAYLTERDGVLTSRYKRAPDTEERPHPPEKIAGFGRKKDQWPGPEDLELLIGKEDESGKTTGLIDELEANTALVQQLNQELGVDLRWADDFRAPVESRTESVRGRALLNELTETENRIRRLVGGTARVIVDGQMVRWDHGLRLTKGLGDNAEERIRSLRKSRDQGLNRFTRPIMDWLEGYCVPEQHPNQAHAYTLEWATNARIHDIEAESGHVTSASAERTDLRPIQDRTYEFGQNPPPDPEHALNPSKENVFMWSWRLNHIFWTVGFTVQFRTGELPDGKVVDGQWIHKYQHVVVVDQKAGREQIRDALDEYMRDLIKEYRSPLALPVAEAGNSLIGFGGAAGGYGLGTLLAELNNMQVPPWALTATMLALLARYGGRTVTGYAAANLRLRAEMMAELYDAATEGGLPPTADMIADYQRVNAEQLAPIAEACGIEPLKLDSSAKTEVHATADERADLEQRVEELLVWLQRAISENTWAQEIPRLGASDFARYHFGRAAGKSLEKKGDWFRFPLAGPDFVKDVNLDVKISVGSEWTVKNHTADGLGHLPFVIVVPEGWHRLSDEELANRFFGHFSPLVNTIGSSFKDMPGSWDRLKGPALTTVFDSLAIWVAASSLGVEALVLPMILARAGAEVANVPASTRADVAGQQAFKNNFYALLIRMSNDLSTGMSAPASLDSLELFMFQLNLYATVMESFVETVPPRVATVAPSEDVVTTISGFIENWARKNTRITEVGVEPLDTYPETEKIADLSMEKVVEENSGNAVLVKIRTNLENGGKKGPPLELNLVVSLTERDVPQVFLRGAGFRRRFAEAKKWTRGKVVEQYRERLIYLQVPRKWEQLLPEAGLTKLRRTLDDLLGRHRSLHAPPKSLLIQRGAISAGGGQGVPGIAAFLMDHRAVAAKTFADGLNNIIAHGAGMFLNDKQEQRSIQSRTGAYPPGTVTAHLLDQAWELLLTQEYEHIRAIAAEVRKDADARKDNTELRDLADTLDALSAVVAREPSDHVADAVQLLREIAKDEEYVEAVVPLGKEDFVQRNADEEEYVEDVDPPNYSGFVQLFVKRSGSLPARRVVLQIVPNNPGFGTTLHPDADLYAPVKARIVYDPTDPGALRRLLPDWIVEWHASPLPDQSATSRVPDAAVGEGSAGLERVVTARGDGGSGSVRDELAYPSMSAVNAGAQTFVNRQFDHKEREYWKLIDLIKEYQLVRATKSHEQMNYKLRSQAVEMYRRIIAARRAAAEMAGNPLSDEALALAQSFDRPSGTTSDTSAPPDTPPAPRETEKEPTAGPDVQPRPDIFPGRENEWRETVRKFAEHGVDALAPQLGMTGEQVRAMLEKEMKRTHLLTPREVDPKAKHLPKRERKRLEGFVGDDLVDWMTDKIWLSPRRIDEMAAAWLRQVLRRRMGKAVAVGDTAWAEAVRRDQEITDMVRPWIAHIVRLFGKEISESVRKAFEEPSAGPDRARQLVDRLGNDTYGKRLSSVGRVERDLRTSSIAAPQTNGDNAPDGSSSVDEPALGSDGYDAADDPAIREDLFAELDVVRDILESLDAPLDSGDTAPGHRRSRTLGVIDTPWSTRISAGRRSVETGVVPDGEVAGPGDLHPRPSPTDDGRSESDSSPDSGGVQAELGPPGTSSSSVQAVPASLTPWSGRGPRSDAKPLRAGEGEAASPAAITESGDPNEVAPAEADTRQKLLPEGVAAARVVLREIMELAGPVPDSGLADGVDLERAHQLLTDAGSGRLEALKKICGKHGFTGYPEPVGSPELDEVLDAGGAGYFHNATGAEDGPGSIGNGTRVHASADAAARLAGDPSGVVRVAVRPADVAALPDIDSLVATQRFVRERILESRDRLTGSQSPADEALARQLTYAGTIVDDLDSFAAALGYRGYTIGDPVPENRSLVVLDPSLLLTARSGPGGADDRSAPHPEAKTRDSADSETGLTSMEHPGVWVPSPGRPDLIDDVAVSAEFHEWMAGYNSRPEATSVERVLDERAFGGENGPRSLADLLLTELRPVWDRVAGIPSHARIDENTDYGVVLVVSNPDGDSGRLVKTVVDRYPRLRNALWILSGGTPEPLKFLARYEAEQLRLGAEREGLRLEGPQSLRIVLDRQAEKSMHNVLNALAIMKLSEYLDIRTLPDINNFLRLVKDQEFIDVGAHPTFLDEEQRRAIAPLLYEGTSLLVVSRLFEGGGPRTNLVVMSTDQHAGRLLPLIRKQMPTAGEVAVVTPGSWLPAFLQGGLVTNPLDPPVPDDQVVAILLELKGLIDYTRSGTILEQRLSEDVIRAFNVLGAYFPQVFKHDQSALLGDTVELDEILELGEDISTLSEQELAERRAGKVEELKKENNERTKRGATRVWQDNGARALELLRNGQYHWLSDFAAWSADRFDWAPAGLTTATALAWGRALKALGKEDRRLVGRLFRRYEDPGSVGELARAAESALRRLTWLVVSPNTVPASPEPVAPARARDFDLDHSPTGDRAAPRGQDNGDDTELVTGDRGAGRGDETEPDGIAPKAEPSGAPVRSVAKVSASAGPELPGESVHYDTPIPDSDPGAAPDFVDTPIDYQIRVLETALGIHTEADRSLELSLYQDYKSRRDARAENAEHPEFTGDGPLGYAGWLDARVFSLLQRDNPLTPEILLEIHWRMKRRLDRLAGTVIGANNAGWDELAEPPSEDTIAVIERNPLLTYMPGVFTTDPHGIMFEPVTTGRPGARKVRWLTEPITPAQWDAMRQDPLLSYWGPGVSREHGVMILPAFGDTAESMETLRELCDWYNEEIENPDANPFEIAARFEQELVSGHVLGGDGHKRHARIVRMLILAKAGLAPSANTRFHDVLLTTRTQFTAALAEGSERYMRWRHQIGEADGRIDPVALFDMGAGDYSGSKTTISGRPVLEPVDGNDELHADDPDNGRAVVDGDRRRRGQRRPWRDAASRVATFNALKNGPGANASEPGQPANGDKTGDALRDTNLTDGQILKALKDRASGELGPSAMKVEEADGRRFGIVDETGKPWPLARALVLRSPAGALLFWLGTLHTREADDPQWEFVEKAFHTFSEATNGRKRIVLTELHRISQEKLKKMSLEEARAVGEYAHLAKLASSNGIPVEMPDMTPVDFLTRSDNKRKNEEIFVLHGLVNLLWFGRKPDWGPQAGIRTREDLEERLVKSIGKLRDDLTATGKWPHKGGIQELTYEKVLEWFKKYFKEDFNLDKDMGELFRWLDPNDFGKFDPHISEIKEVWRYGFFDLRNLQLVNRTNELTAQGYNVMAVFGGSHATAKQWLFEEQMKTLADVYRSGQHTGGILMGQDIPPDDRLDRLRALERAYLDSDDLAEEEVLLEEIRTSRKILESTDVLSILEREKAGDAADSDGARPRAWGRPERLDEVRRNLDVAGKSLKTNAPEFVLRERTVAAYEKREDLRPVRDQAIVELGESVDSPSGLAVWKLELAKLEPRMAEFRGIPSSALSPADRVARNRARLLRHVVEYEERFRELDERAQALDEEVEGSGFPARTENPAAKIRPADPVDAVLRTGEDRRAMVEIALDEIRDGIDQQADMADVQSTWQDLGREQKKAVLWVIDSDDPSLPDSALCGNMYLNGQLSPADPDGAENVRIVDSAIESGRIPSDTTMMFPLDRAVDLEDPAWLTGTTIDLPGYSIGRLGSDPDRVGTIGRFSPVAIVRVPTTHPLLGISAVDPIRRPGALFRDIRIRVTRAIDSDIARGRPQLYGYLLPPGGGPDSPPQSQ